ncbi:hypothetical protein OG607_31900 [Streptomyces sp. NBC_01537]|uniref:hypothetical protein n=1 Tax=Streptomyces sp. NBC_01537 TaxID=2903896 RepID=UPI00386BE2DB
MLKKALACASLAVAATGAAGAIAPAAMASDTSGGSYSQNTNLIPHPCVDVKYVLNGVGAVGVPVPILNEFGGQQCNEKSKIKDNHKSPLSDLLDIGAYQD